MAVISEIVFSLRDFVQYFKNYSGREASARHEAEGFFAFFARIAFPAQQTPFVIQRSAGSIDFGIVGVFFRNTFSKLFFQPSADKFLTNHAAAGVALPEEFDVICCKQFIVDEMAAFALV